ncbi:hypothetical protein H6764_01385 [Candidatus Nomurabacteria bacterium]|nr:hypothetical protein [Candidatus Nomurabacteria bacterium]
MAAQFNTVQTDLSNRGISPDAIDLGICLRPESIRNLGAGVINRITGLADSEVPPIHSIEIPDRYSFPGIIENTLNELAIGLRTGSLTSGARQAFQRLMYFGSQPVSYDARLALQETALNLLGQQTQTSVKLRVGTRFLTDPHDAYCIREAVSHATYTLMGPVKILVEPDYLRDQSLESFLQKMKDAQARQPFDKLELSLSLDIASLVMMIIRENPSYTYSDALSKIVTFVLTNPELIGEIEISPFATDDNPENHTFGQKTAMSVTMGVPLSVSTLRLPHVGQILSYLRLYGHRPGILFNTHPADISNGDLAETINGVLRLR